MSDLERIGSDARRELARFQGTPGLAELVAAWPTAVGPEIASNAWPARLARDGTLHVSTSSSAWAFELTQLAGEVLARLHEKARENVPKGLRFAPGPLPSAARDLDLPALSRRRVPGPKARSQAASLAAGIEDEELRRIVADAAAASLERAASDRSV